MELIIMSNYIGEDFYQIWNQKSVLADCFRKLGRADLANELHTGPLNGDIIEKYVVLAKKHAEKNQDNDVIERLCFAGLIYG